MVDDAQLLLVVDESPSTLHQDELNLIDLSLATADSDDHDESFRNEILKIQKTRWTDSEVYYCTVLGTLCTTSLRRCML